MGGELVMKITVTFADTGDPNLPDGTTLVFEDIEQYSLSTPAEIEQISCADAGCDGCGAAHHRHTGPARLELTASGDRRGLRWVMPELYMIGSGKPPAGASGLEVLKVAAEGAAGDAS